MTSGIPKSNYEIAVSHGPHPTIKLKGSGKLWIQGTPLHWRCPPSLAPLLGGFGLPRGSRQHKLPNQPRWQRHLGLSPVWDPVWNQFFIVKQCQTPTCLTQNATGIHWTPLEPHPRARRWSNMSMLKKSEIPWEPHPLRHPNLHHWIHPSRCGALCLPPAPGSSRSGSPLGWWRWRLGPRPWRRTRHDARCVRSEVWAAWSWAADQALMTWRYTPYGISWYKNK